MRSAEIRFSGIRSGRKFPSTSRNLSLAPDFGADCGPSSQPSAFLREPSKGTKASPTCQAGKPGTNLIPDPALRRAGFARAAQISKNNPAKCPRSPRGVRAEVSTSGVLQWLVLSRESLQGLEGTLSSHLAQRTSFPLPSNRNASRGRPLLFLRFRARATGRLHCLTFNLIRVAQGPSRCKHSACR
jgi:hypothetical protein